MDQNHSWKRRFVAYVEASRVSNGYRYLTVKIPEPMAAGIERDCREKGQHAMVYYCDAFALGLSQALTTAETKHLA